MTIAMITYTKNGKKWETNTVYHDVNTVYKSLAETLQQYYVLKCNWVSRVTQCNNYDGTRTITVYVKDSDGRASIKYEYMVYS